MTSERQAERRRTTRETDVLVRLTLEGGYPPAITTGVGFLDHMLTSLATHSGFALEVSATGDLQVDSHHTVEDVGLVLGETFSQALGDRAGIERFGHAVVPMDESLAMAAVDCSGRGYGLVEIGFVGLGVGGIPTSLLTHFFEVFARSGGLTLHLSAHGEDDHHLAEASFKALARALRQAVRRDPDHSIEVPSTKGVL
ncbi:MAG: imidazoleglycerol-phosphate dehydratase HisB [Candidatus Dormibacteria bacterium]